MQSRLPRNERKVEPSTSAEAAPRCVDMKMADHRQLFAGFHIDPHLQVGWAEAGHGMPMGIVPLRARRRYGQMTA